MSDEKRQRVVVNLRRAQFVVWEPLGESGHMSVHYDDVIRKCTVSFDDFAKVERAMARGDASITILDPLALEASVLSPDEATQSEDTGNEIVRLEHAGGTVEIRRRYIVGVDAHDGPSGHRCVLVQTAYGAVYQVNAREERREREAFPNEWYLHYTETLMELWERVCATVGWPTDGLGRATKTGGRNDDG